jgi:hypothetical protein
MAINFELANYEAPKIDIIGKEVPLAAMEKTGAVLQDRFDKSYENETKTEALMKKLMQDVDEIDRPAAEQAFKTFQERLKERSGQGDYHNMRWQTVRDAQDFGNIYTGLAEKAKLIAAEKAKIAESKDYISDESRTAALNQFKKKLASAQFDNENRIVTGLTVNPFKEAADVNVAERLLSIAPTLRTKTREGKGARFKVIDIMGKKTLVKETESGGIEELTSEEIARELQSWARNDKSISAMIERNMDRLDVFDPNEREKLFDIFFEQEVANVSKSLGDMYEVRKDTRNRDFTPYFDFNFNSGTGDPYAIPGLTTQRPSAQFNNPTAKGDYDLDKDGNIIIPKNAVEFAWDVIVGDDGILSKREKRHADGVEVTNENSTSYKRIINNLKHLGRVNDNTPKDVRNREVINFLNNLQTLESSVTVPMAGDKISNKYFAEKNETYFGIKNPNQQAKGTSIKSGQLAHATFTDERGQKLSADQVAKDNMDKNVRITGRIDQILSPFEYGSDYMVSTDESGKNSHYLIEPDQNTKNSGAYFANRINASRFNGNLESSWQDGYGTNYVATPIKGGQAFLIYVNNDVKNPVLIPIVKSEKELEKFPLNLQFLANSAPGEASAKILESYNSKKNIK